MSQTSVGLARVCCQASNYLDIFAGWLASDVKDVSDLSLGIFDLVLSRCPQDDGWAPVVIIEYIECGNYVRFTWMHSECLGVPSTGNDERVRIGHTGIVEGVKHRTILAASPLERDVTTKTLYSMHVGVDVMAVDHEKVIVVMLFTSCCVTLRGWQTFRS